ncbi:MAG: ABC transporter permease [Gammaproteobacteria bacterium]|nr:ABC transporter permease [Gammaproteobacteria bacterium]
MPEPASTTNASIHCERPGAGVLLIRLGGDWLLAGTRPATVALLTELAGREAPARIEFDTQALGHWDTGLMIFLSAVRRAAESRSAALDTTGLPEGARKLLDLAFAVPERAGARRTRAADSLVVRIGKATQQMLDRARELLAFLGELTQSFSRLLRGRAVFDRADLMKFFYQAGAQALGIVSLISFLIGVIFAFVGAYQMEQFGAGIYVANLVAVAMVREMAAIMTGIIMAGRTGAAFAAQLGTMKVNEEIDALRVLGLNPMDFLVLPRAIALIVMMPLLTLYADLLGIAGGMVAALAMLDISFVQYLEQSFGAVQLHDLFGGLFKSLVYGTLVTVAGCQQGMACGNSARAVGDATTGAVVMGILLIVISASVLTVIYTVLNI